MRRLPGVTLRAWGGFAIIVALVLGTAFAMHRQRSDAVEARRSAEATIVRIDHLNRLLVQMLDVEVGQRGYVITGNPTFLEPYRAGARQVGGTLQTVGGDAAADGDGASFARLEPLVHAKLRYAARTIALRDERGLDAAATEVGRSEGKRLMDAIRREVGAMIAHERRQLALRSSLSQRQERNAEQIVVASLVGTLALTLGVGLMLLFQIRRRLKAEQRARRAARLVQETLDNAGIGVAVADRDGRIVARNADLVRMLPELADSDAPALLETERAAARDRRPFLVERKLGRTSAVLRGVLLSDDRYLITVADVTEARRAEQAKSEFVATVSHELRTPVTSIRGALGMLAGPLASGLPDKHKSLVELALRNADRLTLLINDILDVEKIESGSMTFALEPCDANKLVRDAAEMNRAYADARGVTLALGALARPLLVLADPHRIQQVLANLISNAVKFSDAGGLVQVTAVPGSGGAVISVHDRGPGIPPEFRDRIFERFAQADATDARTKGGTGLGLSISKAIVEKHGGRLRFESQPGSTTFSFELPLHSTDAQVYDGESVPCSTHEVACP